MPEKLPVFLAALIKHFALPALLCNSVNCSFFNQWNPGSQGKDNIFNMGHLQVFVPVTRKLLAPPIDISSHLPQKLLSTSPSSRRKTPWGKRHWNVLLCFCLLQLLMQYQDGNLCFSNLSEHFFVCIDSLSPKKDYPAIHWSSLRTSLLAWNISHWYLPLWFLHNCCCLY